MMSRNANEHVLLALGVDCIARDKGKFTGVPTHVPLLNISLVSTSLVKHEANAIELGLTQRYYCD